MEKAWKFKKFVLSRDEDRRKEITENKVCSDYRDKEYFSDDRRDINCEICFKIFTTATQLHQHKLQIHNDEQLSQNIFTCYNCNLSCNKKENLIFHIENEHREDKLYAFNTILKNDHCEISEECDWEDDSKDDQDSYKFCNQSCSTKEVFEPHFKTCLKDIDDIKICIENDGEINEEIYKHLCSECSINFASNQELNLHNFSKHNVQRDVELVPNIKKRRGRKPLRKFYCEICNEEFSYVKLVIEHCVSIHAMDIKIVKPYSCEKCEMRFVSSANLDQHRNYHDKNRTHICSLCGKGFITKSDLTVHEYTHYNRRNYKCTMCDKAFNTNKNLRTHNLVVHTDRSLWKYACSVCEKRFPLKTNYDQHLRRHTGEKAYACHICKKPFISKSELQRHVHMHSNIKAFKCNDCDKEYKERRTYQTHLAKKHGIGNVKIAIREKKFVCHICPSQFYDKQKLMRHICSHSGLKPFACYACNKKFTDKSYLKHHLKTAHNIVEQSKNGDVQ